MRFPFMKRTAENSSPGYAFTKRTTPSRLALLMNSVATLMGWSHECFRSTPPPTESFASPATSPNPPEKMLPVESIEKPPPLGTKICYRCGIILGEDCKVATLHAFHKETGEEREFIFPYHSEECLNMHREEIFMRTLLKTAVELYGEVPHSLALN